MNAVAANDLIDRTKRTLDQISNAALATVGQDGRPWNSPLYVAFDERLTFYWASQRDAVHLENIRANPDVIWWYSTLPSLTILATPCTFAARPWKSLMPRH